MGILYDIVKDKEGILFVDGKKIAGVKLTVTVQTPNPYALDDKGEFTPESYVGKKER